MKMCCAAQNKQSIMTTKLIILGLFIIIGVPLTWPSYDIYKPVGHFKDFRTGQEWTEYISKSMYQKASYYDIHELRTNGVLRSASGFLEMDIGCYSVLEQHVELNNCARVGCYPALAAWGIFWIFCLGAWLFFFRQFCKSAK
jgi:hypothetical protein